MAVKEYNKTEQKPLSKNFRLSEFRCKCHNPDCTVTKLDDALVEWLQKIRDHFGRSVNVNSGYRCEKHNTYVGGDPGSHHKKGMAADIRVEGILPEEVAKYAESIGIQRIGLYSDFVHIGSSPSKRFWVGHEGVLVDTHGGAPVQEISLKLPVLKRGMKNDIVEALQTLLSGHTGYALGVDGSFGPATEEALEAFQSDHALQVDGSCGPATWAALLGVGA